MYSKTASQMELWWRLKSSLWPKLEEDTTKGSNAINSLELVDFRSLCDWESELPRGEDSLKWEKVGWELSCDDAEPVSLPGLRTLLVWLKSMSKRSSLDLDLNDNKVKLHDSFNYIYMSLSSGMSSGKSFEIVPLQRWVSNHENN